MLNSGLEESIVSSPPNFNPGDTRVGGSAARFTSTWSVVRGRASCEARHGRVEKRRSLWRELLVNSPAGTGGHQRAELLRSGLPVAVPSTHRAGYFARVQVWGQLCRHSGIQELTRCIAGCVGNRVKNIDIPIGGAPAYAARRPAGARGVSAGDRRCAVQCAFVQRLTTCLEKSSEVVKALDRPAFSAPRGAPARARAGRRCRPVTRRW